MGTLFSAEEAAKPKEPEDYAGTCVECGDEEYECDACLFVICPTCDGPSTNSDGHVFCDKCVTAKGLDELAVDAAEHNNRLLGKAPDKHARLFVLDRSKPPLSRWEYQKLFGAISTLVGSGLVTEKGRTQLETLAMRGDKRVAAAYWHLNDHNDDSKLITLSELRMKL